MNSLIFLALCISVILLCQYSKCEEVIISSAEQENSDNSKVPNNSEDSNNSEVPNNSEDSNNSEVPDSSKDFNNTENPNNFGESDGKNKNNESFPDQKRYDFKKNLLLRISTPECQAYSKLLHNKKMDMCQKVGQCMMNITKRGRRNRENQRKNNMTEEQKEERRNARNEENRRRNLSDEELKNMTKEEKRKESRAMREERRAMREERRAMREDRRDKNRRMRNEAKKERRNKKSKLKNERKDCFMCKERIKSEAVKEIMADNGTNITMIQTCFTQLRDIYFPEF